MCQNNLKQSKKKQQQPGSHSRQPQHPGAKQRKKQQSWESPREQPQPQLNAVALMAPRFDNPTNNCWFNSVLQVLVQAIRSEGDSINLFEAPIQEHLRAYGEAIYVELQKYQQPGQYSVNSICTSSQRRLSLKQLMLFAMGIARKEELHSQRDAADCFSTILLITRKLSFLWHIQLENFECENCRVSVATSTPHPIAPVAISNSIRRNSIDAAGAIRNFFESTERGIERDCQNCHGKKSTKSTTLPTPPKFIVVQLLRFQTRKLRNVTTVHKIDNEAEPFSSVEIHTGQGICNYEVIASIQHIGTRMDQGHYIAYIKRDNNWLCCNDQIITPLGNTANEPTRHAYIVLLQHADD